MSDAPGTGADWVFAPSPAPSLPVRDARERLPVHRIYCVGQNYSAHAREMGESGRQPPFFFSKPADALHLESVVPWPSMTSDLHHEVELVVALAAGGRDIAVGDAQDKVFGYAVGVDLTRRDLQAAAKAAGRPWTTAKGFDHSAPLSPLRRVADGGHPTKAGIRLSVNGALRQDGRTEDMTWSVPEIIAELSRYFELRAGDLIFTGTPPGVSALAPGDGVVAEIDGVGRLEFRMALR